MRVATLLSAMVTAWVSLRIRPHKRGEVLSAVDALCERMRQAPGCVRCRILTDVDDENVVALTSEWEDASVAETFFDSRAFRLFGGIRILLRDEPLITLDDVRSRVTRLLRHH